MSVTRIAVAGNPNSGKSTLFNALSGANAKVGNYPGVTVERREARCRLSGADGQGKDTTLIDLPGCYSLTARSPEEEIAYGVMAGYLGTPPDRILCVVDATNLGRGLYLVQQLRERQADVVVALNMMDQATDEGLALDSDTLAQRLGLPVVPISARNREGLESLMQTVTTDGQAQDVQQAQDAAILDTMPEDLRGPIIDCQSLLQEQKHRATVGDALWWLTSDLDANLHALPENLVVKAKDLRQKLPKRFNERVIEARYAQVDRVLKGVESRAEGSQEGGESANQSRQEKVDSILLHPLWGMLVFIATMFVLFQAVFLWADPMITAVEDSIGWLGDHAADKIPEGLTRSLLINGLLAGIGNIIVFLPQIGLLFLGISLLEESGYLARAAYLLDGVMRKVGLHGKAFVPLMSSFACAVPGVMAARTVESSRDRLITILIAPFMSCSARLPVYVLVIAAVFSASAPVFGFISLGGLVITAMYFVGFFAALFTAFLLKRTLLNAPTPPLLLELPPYRMPIWRNVLRHVYTRSRVFVTQTGTVILALSVILWAILTFPQQGLDADAMASAQAHIASLEGDAKTAAEVELAHQNDAAKLRHTVGGRLGRAIEPIIEPLGFDWRIGIGLIASFAAREVLVSTLGQVYALDADIEADSPALRDAILKDIDPITQKPKFSPLVGISLMVFFVLAMQCLSTVATVKRETGSWKWAMGQLFYMNSLAYVVSLAVYQGGRLLGFS